MAGAEIMVDYLLARLQRLARRLWVKLPAPALQPAIKHGCWRDTKHGWKQAAGNCCHYLPQGNISV
jgi:hypothetical protein